MAIELDLKQFDNDEFFALEPREQVRTMVEYIRKADARFNDEDIANLTTDGLRLLQQKQSERQQQQQTPPITNAETNATNQQSATPTDTNASEEANATIPNASADQSNADSNSTQSSDNNNSSAYKNITANISKLSEELNATNTITNMETDATIPQAATSTDTNTSGKSAQEPQNPSILKKFITAKLNTINPLRAVNPLLPAAVDMIIPSKPQVTANGEELPFDPAGDPIAGLINTGLNSSRLTSVKDVAAHKENREILSDKDSTFGQKSAAVVREAGARAMLPFQIAATGYGDIYNTIAGNKRSFEITDAERVRDVDTYLTNRDIAEFASVFPASRGDYGAFPDLFALAGLGEGGQSTAEAEVDYMSEIHKRFGDRYDIQLSDGQFYARPKNRPDLPFKAMGGNLLDGATFVAHMKGTAPEWIPEVAIDLAAFMAFRKAAIAANVGKKMATFLAMSAATLLAKPVGEQSVRFSLWLNDQNVSDAEKERLINSGGWNNMIFSAVGYVLPSVIRGAGIVLKQPLRVIPKPKSVGARRFERNTIQGNMSQSALYKATQEKAELNAASRTFGAIEEGFLSRWYKNSRWYKVNELGYQVGHQEARNILEQPFNMSFRSFRAILEDSIQLTENLRAKLNLSESVSRDIFHTLNGGLKQTKSYYETLYQEAKDTLVGAVGNQRTQGSNTLAAIAKSMEDLTTFKNMIDNEFSGVITPQNKEALEILAQLAAKFKQGKQITDEFTLNGLFDLHKTLNDIYGASIHNLTREQKTALANVRSAIYDDIQKVISNSTLAPNVKQEFGALWKSVNAEYSNYKRLFQDSRIIESLVNDKEFDPVGFAANIMKSANLSFADNRVVLGQIADILRKTQPAKMKGFYDGIVNSMLYEARRETIENGTAGFYTDWKVFRELWNTMDETTKKQVFGGDALGREYLKTLNAFDVVVKREEKLQRLLMRTTESEAGKEEYVARHLTYSKTLAAMTVAWNKVSGLWVASSAYRNFLVNISEKQRFGKIADDPLIKHLEAQVAKGNGDGVTPDDIARLKAMANAADDVVDTTAERIALPATASRAERQEAVAAEINEIKAAVNDAVDQADLAWQQQKVSPEFAREVIDPTRSSYKPDFTLRANNPPALFDDAATRPFDNGAPTPKTDVGETTQQTRQIEDAARTEGATDTAAIDSATQATREPTATATTPRSIDDAIANLPANYKY
ncbi:MAG: hypothetical protein LBN32_00455, partial [Helicobacteraceae bacterium]|nr:hypothetical protein [Helicobacteraceae bacterium]